MTSAIASPPSAVATIRRSVAVTSGDHVMHRLVRGPQARALLDRLLPAELTLRDSQVKQTLLLDEQGRPFADLYVARHDDDFLLLAEGPSPGELDAWLAAHRPPDLDAEIVDLDGEHGAVMLDGPFAWELIAQVVGPEVVSLPFLSLFRLRGWYGLRAGKTGEFGYHLLVPRRELDGLRGELLERGRPLDAAPGDLAALDHCALENWFYNQRREGRLGATPIELQLQWRISYRKDYVGGAALKARRAAGITRRLTCLAGPRPAPPGSALCLDGDPVGEVVSHGYSEGRGAWIALALLDLPLAHPGIDLRGEDDAPWRTFSPPAIENLSLFVDPRRHRYATRDAIARP